MALFCTLSENSIHAKRKKEKEKELQMVEITLKRPCYVYFILKE